MSEVPNGTTTSSSEQPPPGAGLVGAACAAAQPVVSVPVPSHNLSAMQFFAPDPNDDRDAVSFFVLCCSCFSHFCRIKRKSFEQMFQWPGVMAVLSVSLIFCFLI